MVCISETHITEDISDSEIDISGYKASITYSESRHTGGVITYVKEECKNKIILQKSIHMSTWIVGNEVRIKNRVYNIFNLYHSPNASKACLIEELEEILEEYAVKPGILIIVGDFNIDLSKDSFYSDKLRDIIKNNGLFQKVETFTRITEESATTVDLVITNDKQLQHQVHSTPKISDHCILSVELLKQPINVKYLKTYRDFSKFNELDFQLDLMDTQWTSDSTDVNRLSEELVSGIMKVLNEHAPVKERRVNSRWACNDWWTPIIGENIAHRDQLYQKAELTNLKNDWENYKKQRNKVVCLLRKQKESYYREKIDERKGNSVEMWKTLKQLVKNDHKVGKKDGIVFQDGLVKDDAEIANKFNSYFIQSIEDISFSPTKEQIESVLHRMNRSECRMERFKTVEFSELKQTVRKMKNKASSVDGLNTKILKLCFETIGHRFLQVINTSLETGTFPKNWKTSTIIPLEKKNNTVKCEEHRPINMMPLYEKLLEMVINKQIIEYVEYNKLLSTYQAGFRKQKCCESALQTVLADWKNALSRKLMVGVVFLDFRRAFETINRNLLLEKLKNYGFGSVVISLLTEYLEDRYQIVKYNNSISCCKSNIFGVPQGTVMGPNLFILYINDIVDYVDKCRIQLFADDTLLYFIGDNVDTIVDTINSELEILKKWLGSNSLAVNTEKTKFMIIKNRFNNSDTMSHSGVYIDNKKLEQVKECKYLGVIIDENLTFFNHAKYITGKIAKKVSFMGRIGNNLSAWSKLVIYKTIILPHLNYCATVLFLFNNSEINALQKKQNQSMRVILGCNRYTSIKYMLKETKLLSVRQTIFLNSMIFIYKVKHSLLETELLSEIDYVENIHEYDTRSRGNFYVPAVKTSYSQNNLFHRGLVEFNKLPNEVKSCQTLKLFVNRCREYAREHIVV